MKPSEYIIVEMNGALLENHVPAELDGVPKAFASVEKAEAWLRSDAKETLLDSCELEAGHMQDWGTPVAICKVVRLCRPVPVVSVKIEIQEVAE